MSPATTQFRLHAPIVLPCDPDCSVLRDAVVDVGADGRIVYCGPAATAPELSHGVPVRRRSGILLPGLVNAHAHTPMLPLRGIGGDLPLLRWLQEAMWQAEAKLRPEDIGAGMLLGSIEMLRYGVTTTTEMYFRGEHMVEAVLAAGSRMLFTAGIIDVPGFDWRQLLDDQSAWIDSDGRFLGPGDRIELGYGPHSAYTLPPEALSLVGAEAKQRDALVHIHVAEHAEEDTAQRAAYGSVPRMLDELGVLGGRVTMAHAVHLSDADIQLLAANQVGVAHCPGSNAKLASGSARLLDLVGAGIPVGVGTDGPASNDDLDLLDEAKLAALLARLSHSDASAVTARQALLLATRGSADALGRGDLGALETGRWADIVHVAFDDPSFVGGVDVPDEQLVGNLVWAAGARTVREVWVAGEQVVADHEPTRVDRAEAQAAVAAVASRLHD
jgi:5-methylthioadenosine/S-adenosylhomocysteine deaminase